MGKMMPAGMTIIRPNTEKMYVLSSDCVRIKLDKNVATDEFFLYTTKSEAFLNQVNNDSQGSTRVRTSISKIREMDFATPSLEEQAKIGKYFTNLDHLITLHQRECTNLINIKNITLTKMMNPFPDLRFSKFTNVWEQRKLGEVAKYRNGKAHENCIDDNGKYIVVNSKFVSTDGEVKKFSNMQNEALFENEIAFVLSDVPNGRAIARTFLVEKSDKYTLNQRIAGITPLNQTYPYYLYILMNRHPYFLTFDDGAKQTNLSVSDVMEFESYYPIYKEQKQIGEYFRNLDNLITLHQRECKNQNGRCHMLSEVVTTDLFCDYYIQWVKVYKEGAVRKVTLDKYMMTYSWLLKLASHLRLCDITRVTYQQILNDYAITHEKQTTMDFHHQLKGAIADAVDDGLITKDPTRKAIIKGKTPTPKKIKYLNQYELHTLLSNLQLKDEINWDWLILLVAKTGMRFSEALAITPSDFDFAHQMLSISKTWNYKGNGGFLPTKNKSSVRKIQLDWQTVIQFSELVKRLPPEKPIFITKERVYNSTVNDVLARHCTKNNIPVISIHGLRHTHASLLLFAGVSIASVARRLGHSSMTTTQKTYLHIIQELENKDIDLVMRSLSGLS